MSATDTRAMIREAQRITAPPGWSVKWTVEMIDVVPSCDGAKATDVAGWSDFDTFEDALANFRALRTGGNRVPARIVARLEGPIAGQH